MILNPSNDLLTKTYDILSNFLFAQHNIFYLEILNLFDLWKNLEPKVTIHD